MKKKKLLMGLVVIFGLFILYLLFWPVSIDPVAWSPMEAPALSGVFEPNSYLASVKKLGRNMGVGPEDVDVDNKGSIYGGMEDGRIMRLHSDGSSPEVFAHTGGRPLGLSFDANGNLIVADAYKGLILIKKDGSISVLCTAADGLPFGLTDDVDIAQDGTIYFSDATYKYPVNRYIDDAMEHRPHGRLLAYSPKTKSTKVLLDKLYFANGVAVSPDQSFVLVNETWKYRIKRYWLRGPKKGKSDIFIDNLPGIPDGISCNQENIFWLALPSIRDTHLDKLMEMPFLRKVIMRLPKLFLPAPKRYSFVLGLDNSGEIVHNLQDPDGTYAMITSVEQHGDMLYLGSLHEEAIGRVPLPKKE